MIPGVSSSIGGKAKRVESTAPTRTESPQVHYADAAGEISRERIVGAFTLTETIYPARLVLPRHAHRHAYLTFVVEGAVRERYAGSTVLYRTGAIRFLPAGIVHENEFNSPTQCLHVRTDASTLAAMDGLAAVPQAPAEMAGLSAAWLGNRLYAEFLRDDASSAIAAEGLVLEILAEIARTDAAPISNMVPRWLRHATEIVESRFLERLSLNDIASEVGVHYVHLSRQFHKYNRCTVGELIRRRRVQHAAHLLAHSRTPLAEIALMCGFSDQSHLSFIFKRYMGMSPSKFRSLAGLDSSPSVEAGAANA